MFQSQLLFKCEKSKIQSYIDKYENKCFISIKHLLLSPEAIFTKNNERVFKKNKPCISSIIIEQDHTKFYCNVFRKNKDLEVFHLPLHFVEKTQKTYSIPITDNCHLRVNYNITNVCECTASNLDTYYLVYKGNIDSEDILHINSLFALLNTLDNL